MSTNIYIRYVLNQCDESDDIYCERTNKPYLDYMFIFGLVVSSVLIPYFYRATVKKEKEVRQNKSYCITSINIIKLTRYNLIIQSLFNIYHIIMIVLASFWSTP